MSEYERGFKAGIDAAAKWLREHPLMTVPRWKWERTAKTIRALTPPPPQPATPDDCPDCNDGWLTRAFAEPHDIPCPTCNGTMKRPGPPGDDAGRCAECDGKGAHHHVEEPYYVPCFACKGTGRAGGG